MTDEQIIKAADICRTGECSGCPYHELYTASCLNKLTKDVYHLINRQKAEIERLEKESISKEKAYNNEYFLRKKIQDELKDYKAENERLLQKLQQAKSEAIKKFAEKVKREICKNTYAGFDKKENPVNIWEAKAGFKDIDNLVKEMAKEMTEVQE